MLVHSLRDTQSGRSLHLTITALVARGADPFAAMLGIYLHAKAGDHLASSIGALGFLAREILLEIRVWISWLDLPDGRDDISVLPCEPFPSP